MTKRQLLTLKAAMMKMLMMIPISAATRTLQSGTTKPLAMSMGRCSALACDVYGRRRCSRFVQRMRLRVCARACLRPCLQAHACTTL